MQAESSAFNKAQKNIDQFFKHFPESITKHPVFSRVLHSTFLYTKQWNSSLFDSNVYHKIQDPKKEI